jgi:predicted SnoaL-like aldol condensation-catalyzing enzyme
MTDIDPAEENKRRFLDAFGRFAAGEIEVLREIIREDFVSHTVGAPPGRDAWIEFIINSPIATAEIEIQHVVADAEFVVAHYTLIPAEGPSEDVVDIWRFEDGLIVEHWDVSRPQTAGAPVP